MKKQGLALLFALTACAAMAVTITVESPPNKTPRIKFGLDGLTSTLREIGSADGTVSIVLSHDASLGKEGFAVATTPNVMRIKGGDDSGLLYGCAELASRIRAERKIPASLELSETPAMSLRGTCIGMQKTGILPGRRVYEYPYTPELFPWFYNKELWTEYLDRMVQNRFNSLYLWNGHPFASLVRLPDYPDAVEVPPDVFTQNVEMFQWLSAECDKRGIWLVQMFYNIFLPEPLARKHNVPTQLQTPTPLASDYTRKSIAAFIRDYPNVGLMVCLGEALQGTSNQVEWATKTILPGVHEGMRAAGLHHEPPVVIRTHAMNPEAIMPACFQVYSNLYTETKYNGESLTTYEPRGKAQATHLAMAKLGPHIVNVHILSNLEPFRYNAQRFIQKSILASRDRLAASGLHLYPLAYWNWPYSPDAVTPPLKQWERDWLWFEAWGRYAWNPDRLEQDDRRFWLGRLQGFFGCDAHTAGTILDGCNDVGEVAPILVRRFGITEGNRQTLSLGMTLDQLVNPKRYNAIPELWESQAPPGERLDEFVRKELAAEPHSGETPVVALKQVMQFSSNAIVKLDSAAPNVRRNNEEFERWRNDARMIRRMAECYEAKVDAARLVLRHSQTGDIAEMRQASEAMARSLHAFESMTQLSLSTYSFANSMQTGHRKIPFAGAAAGSGTNYHWRHVLPLYQQEYQDFLARVEALQNPGTNANQDNIASWPAAKIRLTGTNAEVFEVKAGARPFMDRRYTITELAPELSGLTGIRFSHDLAKNGRYEPVEFEVDEPVRVLVGYFQNERDIWLQVPNLDVASHADERGGVDVLLRNAAVIEECPTVNVHAFRFEAGKHKLEMIGRGSFVVLGVVPQSVRLEKRDAGKGGK